MFVMRMLVVAAISFSAAGSGWSLPLGIPPAAEDPVMQQIAPPQCLAYVTWSGTAQPNPQSSNQTEQLLAEEEMRQFGAALMQTIEQAIAKNAEQHGPQEVALSKEAVDWAKIVLSHPAAAYVSKFVPAGGTPDVRAGAILNLAPDTAKLRAKLEKFLQGLRPDRVEVRQVAGLSCCYRTHVEPRDSGQPIDWAVKGNYLAITIGEGELEGLLKRIGNQPPAWLGAAEAQLPIPRRSMLAYVNVKAIVDQFGPLGGPRAVEVIKALGVDRIKAVISVVGLDAEGIAAKTLLQCDGALEGIFKLADVSPLTPADLAPIPRDATFAAASRFDAKKIYNTVTSIVGQIDPQKEEEIEHAVKVLELQQGINVRNDLLKPLGNVLCLYTSSGEGMGAFMGITAVISVRDAKRFSGTYDLLLAAAQRALEACGGEGNRAKLEKSQFAGHDLYYLTIPQPGFPLTPSCCLTEHELVLGLFPQYVKAYLNRSKDAVSLAKAPAVATMFASGKAPLKIVYEDTPQLVKSFYPMVQLLARPALAQVEKQGIHFDYSTLPSVETLLKHLRPSTTAVVRTNAGLEIDSRCTLPLPSLTTTPVAAGLLIPAIQAARSAARRAQSSNKLKQH